MSIIRFVSQKEDLFFKKGTFVRCLMSAMLHSLFQPKAVCQSAQKVRLKCARKNEKGRTPILCNTKNNTKRGALSLSRLTVKSLDECLLEGTYFAVRVFNERNIAFIFFVRKRKQKLRIGQENKKKASPRESLLFFNRGIQIRV